MQILTVLTKLMANLLVLLEACGQSYSHRRVRGKDLGVGGLQPPGSAREESRRVTGALVTDHPPELSRLHMDNLNFEKNMVYASH